MASLTDHIPSSSLKRSTEAPSSSPSSYSDFENDDQDIAYYSDASTRSSDTFDHQDYVAAVDPLENPHKSRFEDNVGCVVHVRTDDELDDDTSDSDSDFEPTALQQTPFPPTSTSPTSTSFTNNSSDGNETTHHKDNAINSDSDSSSVYSNEGEYLDNDNNTFLEQASLQPQDSEEKPYHGLSSSTDNNTNMSFTSLSSTSSNSLANFSGSDNYFDGGDGPMEPLSLNRSESADTGASTPPPLDDFDSKLKIDSQHKTTPHEQPDDTADEVYNATNLNSMDRPINHDQSSRNTLRLSTLSISDLNDVSLGEDSTTSTPTAPPSVTTIVSNSVKSPTTPSESDSIHQAPTQLPPRPPAKDRSVKPTPIDTTSTSAPAPAPAPASATTTPTMTPSLSSTTQRLVSGLWSPFKTATTPTKKVVRPSTNFTERQKRQSRPPSCALPGFQEALLAQMEQLNCDNGNDPKAQQLLNLKRQTIRQSLVLASSNVPNKEDYDWEFWTSVICDFDQVQKNKDMSSQVQKGVPPSLRGMVWQLLTKSKQLELLDEQQYIDLLRTSSPYDKMIQRDLARTFPGHDYFKEQDGAGQEGLYNVVRAYSVYDSEVGYCQGLAFIVGPLLLNMPDEEAFGVLIQLMSNYGLRGHFTPNMEGLHLRLYQFDSLVAEYLPHISRHLQRRGIDSTMFASQWFMTLFAYKFPLDLVFRIYDMVFVEGLEAVLKFALALLKRNETHLLELDFEHLLDFLKNGLFEEYKDDERQLVKDVSGWNIPRKRLVQLEKDHKAMMTKEEQDAKLLEALQKQQATIQQQLDHLRQSTATIQKEHQDVQGQLQDSQQQRQQMYDEQGSLKTVVDSLQAEAEKIPLVVEGTFKAEFDQLCTDNAHLNQKNAHLEDQLSAMETLLIDMKMRYAQSENERDELSKRLFELKKVIAQ